ncbi:MAG: type II toxin-antitoxin system VapC family toxin [Dehalococcoidia bacterium]
MSPTPETLREPAPRRVVLDSFAVLAYLQDEPGGRVVLDLLQQAERGALELHMSVINLGEVVYRVTRAYGEDRLRMVLGELHAHPITLHDVDERLAMTAASIKAMYPMAFADCVAAALARHLSAELATGDPELRQIDGYPPLLWLPSPARA